MRSLRGFRTPILVESHVNDHIWAKREMRSQKSPFSPGLHQLIPNVTLMVVGGHGTFIISCSKQLRWKEHVHGKYGYFIPGKERCLCAQF
uniref:Ovule protein n=1 Tax=Steinernema glaseri TaxID=37863 RepID=A0A1I7ZVJ5_9BILA